MNITSYPQASASATPTTKTSGRDAEPSNFLDLPRFLIPDTGSTVAPKCLDSRQNPSGAETDIRARLPPRTDEGREQRQKDPGDAVGEERKGRRVTQARLLAVADFSHISGRAAVVEWVLQAPLQD